MGYEVYGDMTSFLADAHRTKYRSHLTGAGLADDTIRIYLSHIQRIADAVGGYESLYVADADDLRAYSDTTANSHSNRRQLRSALRHWYQHAGREDPPLKAVRVPPKPAPEFRGLEKPAAARLAAVASDRHPDGTAVLVGLYMGLRAAEIAAVRWDRFDPELEWYTVMGKGDRTHTLPVHPVLREALQQHRSAWLYLFPGDRGRAHVTSKTVWGWVQDTAKDAGVGRLGPHQLRHTAIAAVHDGTGDLRAASAFARHLRLETTQIYTRTTREKLRAAVESIDYS